MSPEHRTQATVYGAGRSVLFDKYTYGGVMEGLYHSMRAHINNLYEEEHGYYRPAGDPFATPHTWVSEVVYDCLVGQGDNHSLCFVTAVMMGGQRKEPHNHVSKAMMWGRVAGLLEGYVQECEDKMRDMSTDDFAVWMIGKYNG